MTIRAYWSKRWVVITPVLFRTNYYSIERFSHGVTASCFTLLQIRHRHYNTQNKKYKDGQESGSFEFFVYKSQEGAFQGHHKADITVYKVHS